MPKGVYKRTEETRQKMRDYHLGRKLSQETKDKISKTKTGVKCKKEYSNKGNPWTKARRLAQKKRTTPVIRNGREYSPDWNNIRKAIYKRDNYICQECFKNCGSRIGICCHHIDYDINNNNPENLITLCASCHPKTNFKRIDWIKYFIKKRKELIK